MEDKNKKTKKILSILLVLFIVVSLGFLAWHSRDTIKKFFGLATVYDSILSQADSEGWDAGSGYAWGENIGWVDLSPSFVKSDSLWGYAYGENVGWISMNCGNQDVCGTSDYEVVNDETGNLSGYAYGENIGWVHFGTTDYASRPYGVSISDSGDFSGYAYGENVGWISFNCSNTDTCGSVDYKASTTWRIASTDDRPRVRRRTNEDTNSIKVLRPVAGIQWTAGQKYIIDWILPEATTTDTFIYMTGGGYDENRMIAYASSTDLSMEYYVTDEDLPRIQGASWKVAVCSGEIVGINTDNCGFSGAFYINSAGKKVDPIPVTVATTTPISPTNPATSSPVVELTPIYTVDLPVAEVRPLAPLVEIPKFGGDVTDTFTFVPKIRSFLFEPLPESIQVSLNKFPGVKDYLEAIGFSNQQDLIRLKIDPLNLVSIPDPVPAGIFLVNNGPNNLKTQLVADDEYKVLQSVRIASGTKITIKIKSYDGAPVFGEWRGEKIPFIMNGRDASLDFSANTLGRYVLTSKHSAIPLAIEVYEKPKTNNESETQEKKSWWSRALGLFGR